MGLEAQCELYGLFGKMSRQSCASCNNDYSVVAMHPDANVVFIVQDWNQN
jgi:hypothetical protein